MSFLASDSPDAPTNAPTNAPTASDTAGCIQQNPAEAITVDRRGAPAQRDSLNGDKLLRRHQGEEAMTNLTSRSWVKQLIDTGVLPLMAAGAAFTLALIIISVFVLRWLLV